MRFIGYFGHDHTSRFSTPTQTQRRKHHSVSERRADNFLRPQIQSCRHHQSFISSHSTKKRIDSMKQPFSLPNLGILTALASSLCCIMPVLAIVAGTSGLASTFSWLEPARPYFIGSTALILGFAWYQKLKPQAKDDCGCDVPTKMPFMQSSTFLGIITMSQPCFCPFQVMLRFFS